MKGFTYLVIVASIAVCGVADKENFIKMKNECKTELGIEENIDENHPQVNCLVACILKRKGVLKDGKLLIDAIVEMIKKSKMINEGKETKFKECLTEANTKSDECEVAAASRKCVITVYQD